MHPTVPTIDRIESTVLAFLFNFYFFLHECKPQPESVLKRAVGDGMVEKGKVYCIYEFKNLCWNDFKQKRRLPSEACTISEELNVNVQQ